MAYQDPPLTEAMIEEHGLNAEEYARLEQMIGRAPTYTELGIISAMWNEHCSYKSSKVWLKTLPTQGSCVVSGPGENAGVIDIGDGEVAIFKMESHNHPSFIEPYQGAATGVGGILRDVFAMGARPVALLNALRFGALDAPRMKELVSGVVAGIGGYGNSFGVPTVGGEVNFHPRYDGNILVNAMAVGVAKKSGIFYAKAYRAGTALLYLGAKTGRDGVGGATMASAEFSGEVEEKRPTVQVGDPFLGKCLLEASLALMASGMVLAIQDMGAAGLTCSAVEMGAKGNLGVELDLDRVPQRDPNMVPYEMMLSESQERMLLVVAPDDVQRAQAIAQRWGVTCVDVGEIKPHDRFIVRFQGEVVADLPIQGMGDNAPCYERPWHAPPKLAPLSDDGKAFISDVSAALLTLMGCPDGCSKRWIFEQYDSLIQSGTLQGPGGDAAVVRLSPHKALALSSDVTPRYVEADPFEGAKQAVVECWRNLTAVGATPLAITDNLNFGNPENPIIMGQFVRAIEGISEACTALSFPVVSGNVSLYNETSKRSILPTPTIGGVGLVHPDRTACLAFQNEGDLIFLIGPHGHHLGQSLYLREVFEREDGTPPPVDLAQERRHGDFIRDGIGEGMFTAVHDISDGGLLVAVCEMALAGNLGAELRLEPPQMTHPHLALFGEDQGRYVVAISPEKASSLVQKTEEVGVECHLLGSVGGEAMTVIGVFSQPLSHLRSAHETALPKAMDTLG